MLNWVWYVSGGKEEETEQYLIYKSNREKNKP